jgi:hypothetical protein
MKESKKASVWRALAVAKDKALKEPKQQWGCIVDLEEAWVLKGWLEVPLSQYNQYNTSNWGGNENLKSHKMIPVYTITP